jgi:hypothetical protein
LRLVSVIPWFGAYLASVNGPDPAMPWEHRCCGVLAVLASDTSPSECVDVAWRNCAFGCLKVTFAVWSSTTVVPV